MSLPRCKRYVDGMVSLPWDLLRDPSLIPTHRLIALAIAALADGGVICEASMETIGAECGVRSRCVMEAVKALIEAGWLARGELARGSSHRRALVLCWLLPDDFEGMVPLGFGAARPRRRAVPAGPLPLIVAASEGGAH